MPEERALGVDLPAPVTARSHIRRNIPIGVTLQRDATTGTAPVDQVFLESGCSAVLVGDHFRGKADQPTEPGCGQRVAVRNCCVHNVPLSMPFAGCHTALSLAPSRSSAPRSDGSATSASVMRYQAPDLVGRRPPPSSSVGALIVAAMSSGRVLVVTPAPSDCMRLSRRQQARPLNHPLCCLCEASRRGGKAYRQPVFRRTCALA